MSDSLCLCASVVQLIMKIVAVPQTSVGLKFSSFPVSSCLHPVFDTQDLDTLKMAQVTCDQQHIVRNGNRGDLNIGERE